MSLTDTGKSRVPSLDKSEVPRMQREMEARRLLMLKMIEESKAKLKSLLHVSPQTHFDETNPPRS